MMAFECAHNLDIKSEVVKSETYLNRINAFGYEYSWLLFREVLDACLLGT